MDAFPAPARRFSTRCWAGSADLRRNAHGKVDSEPGWPVMAEYNMNKERYTIGRLPDNDIRIDNAAVSGHHSLIINILNDSFLEDLNSTNGTYVNGKLIKKHALQHGDVITVGHHQLRFVEDDEAAGRVREDHGDPALAAPGGEAAQRRRSGRPAPPARLSRHRHARARWPTARRDQEGEAAGAVGRLRRPRARAHQGAHDARAARRAGRGHHAPRRKATSSCTSTAEGETTSRWSTAPRSAPRRAS